MTMITLTESNFDEVVQNTDYLLIEFSAEWCAPCQGYQKVLHACAADFPEFTFATVDIEQEAALAEEFQVRSVPATMILRNSVIVCMQAGALTQAALEELLVQTKQLDPEQLVSDGD
jgi:thioredoxin 1